MSGLRLLAPVGLAAVLTVTAVSWWLTGSDETPPAAVAFAGIAEQPPADRPLPPLPPDEGLSEEEVWAQLEDPANSDLRLDVFEEARRIGAEVVRADATGQGRERWPEYWSEEHDKYRATACCSRVEVHAAGADWDGELVRAIVVWSGWIGDELVVHEATAVVFLTSHEEAWAPMRRQLHPAGTPDRP